MSAFACCRGERVMAARSVGGTPRDGACTAQDHQDAQEVNAKLDEMGYGIGQRLIDELLAKSNVGQCTDLRETAEVIAKVGFKMFLGVAANVGGWGQEVGLE